MFEAIVDKVKSLPLLIWTKVKAFALSVWKKAAVSLAAGVVAYLVLRYVVAGLLSLGVVSLAGACVAVYLVWTRVALWEVRELAAKAGIKLDL